MTNEGPRIERIQKVLTEKQIPAWLFYDFRASDPIAYRILGLDPDSHPTRRWFYLIPAEGQPTKLVHRIESSKLDSLPGDKHVYVRWQELHAYLEKILAESPTVAMQYSAGNTIPYVSYVDAGTAELIGSLGAKIVTSADLIQQLEAVWTPQQLEQHRIAAHAVTRIVQEAFEETRKRIQNNLGNTEFDVQQFILQCFEREGLETDYPPIVAVNENSSDPHYCPQEGQSRPIFEGDFLLIDLWAKTDVPDAVFADITWTAVFAENPLAEMTRIFEIVTRARDRGVQFLEERLSSDTKVVGCEVDDAVREVIIEAGFGDYFTHRTGHSLGREVHGSGANFDNIETRDEREIVPGLGCTIEPGIYLDGFGVRSEINITIGEAGPEITTPPQKALLTFPCD